MDGNDDAIILGTTACKSSNIIFHLHSTSYIQPPDSRRTPRDACRPSTFSENGYKRSCGLTLPATECSLTLSTSSLVIAL
jgi:hypothetical protein